MATAGAASTPALPVTPPGTAPGLSCPQRPGGLRAGLRLRNSEHTSRLPPSLLAWGGACSRFLGSGPRPPPHPLCHALPLAPPSSLPTLTSSWALWNPLNAVRPWGRETRPRRRSAGLVTKTRGEGRRMRGRGWSRDRKDRSGDRNRETRREALISHKHTPSPTPRGAPDPSSSSLPSRISSPSPDAEPVPAGSSPGVSLDSGSKQVRVESRG